MFRNKKITITFNFISKFIKVGEKNGVSIKPENLKLQLTQKSKESFLTISNKRPFHESDLKNTEKYSQIFSDITDVKEEAEKDIKFEPLSFINIKKGEKYIPTIFKHLESKEERIVKHEKGEVLILVFWTLWFSISWVAVTEILRMLRTKHEKWNGKVRIVTVSLLQDHDEEVSTYIKKFRLGKI